MLGPPVSGRRRGLRRQPRCGLVGPVLVVGWAGSTREIGENGPLLLEALCLLKQLSLIKGLRKGFEFDCQSDSNNTQMNFK
jgi:hypothetical protein